MLFGGVSCHVSVRIHMRSMYVCVYIQEESKKLNSFFRLDRPLFLIVTHTHIKMNIMKKIRRTKKMRKVHMKSNLRCTNSPYCKKKKKTTTNIIIKTNQLYLLEANI